jgi:hypothetical protein
MLFDFNGTLVSVGPGGSNPNVVEKLKILFHYKL